MTTRLLSLACLVTLLWTSPARAQLAAPGEAGVAMGHVHLVARDLDASRHFFAALGGTPVQNGTLQMFRFPGVFILLRQAEPTGGTVGSVMNHFGFNVKDIKRSVARWQAAGLKVEAGNGTTSIAFLTDPWGTYIELTEGLAP